MKVIIEGTEKEDFPRIFEPKVQQRYIQTIRKRLALATSDSVVLRIDGVDIVD